MKYLSYRNLAEKGGPEFTLEQAKAIASSFEELKMDLMRMAICLQDQENYLINLLCHMIMLRLLKLRMRGAYPPDMSVLVKARGGGVDYIYSLLQGYEDPPIGVTLDDGVYYNKYMYGNKIKMANQLSDGLVEYSDGTNSTVEQMSKDVTTFLMWAAEPHLESRHQMGFKAIVYLIILTILVYFSMKKIWSRVETKV